MIWLQGWVFAKHDIILWTGTIIIGNVKWKWGEQEKVFCLDDGFTEVNSLNLPPSLLRPLYCTLPDLIFHYSVNDKKDDMSWMLEVCSHYY